MKLFDLLHSRADELSLRLVEHLKLALTATGIAVVVGVSLGYLAVRSKHLRDTVLGVASILQTIPSLALLTFLLPFLGIGTTPAIVALTLYALLPIVRNTYAGLSQAPPAMIEMANALGLSGTQKLFWIEARFALPFIIAGIRTAAVVSVGIATLSAFIGAGGLGVFINRGLAINNTDLVLFGAVPAGLLALYIDFCLATAEGYLKPLPKKLPLGIQSGVLAFLALFTVVGLHSLTKPKLAAMNTGDKVVVGSKNFTEQLILGHMMAILLEDKSNLRVERKLNLAGTAVCQQALVDGGIDMYPEYTGTALLSVLKVDAPSDADEAWKVVQEEYSKKFNLDWLPKLGFANTYALAVRSEQAEKNNWETVSDLQPQAGKLKAGFTAEFLERDDGYPGLSKRYGFKFGSTVDVDPGLMYDAVHLKKVDIVSAFSTDGRIAAYNLKLLEDNRHFFPPYDAAIVVRHALLEKHPEVRDILEKLSGKLDEATMQKLNLAVDRDKRQPRDVAREFLVKQGLIDK
ncbi:MAG: ABC transporter permease subunit [Armatimonadetes bacterium]|nr:ABC transporter permease subunit [Armatimonadota bacterium]